VLLLLVYQGMYRRWKALKIAKARRVEFQRQAKIAEDKMAAALKEDAKAAGRETTRCAGCTETSGAHRTSSLLSNASDSTRSYIFSPIGKGALASGALPEACHHTQQQQAHRLAFATMHPSAAPSVPQKPDNTVANIVPGGIS
jgi:hypothetical protein